MVKHILSLIFTICILHASFGKTDTTFQRLISLKDSKEKVNQLNGKSEEFWQLGDYSISLKYANEAVKTAKKINYGKGLGFAYNNIGIINDYQGQYVDALDNYFNALRVQKAIKDENGLAYTYSNIGLIYTNQHNYKEALKNHERALFLRKKNKDLRGLSSTYNNLGIVYMDQDNFNKALDNYFESIRIDSLLGEESGMSASYSNIGLVYMDLGQFTKAHEYFQKALSIREKLNDKWGIANSNNNIGTLLLKENKNKEASQYLLRGLEMGKEMNAKEIIQYSYQMLYNIAEKEGKTAEAFDYYKNFILYSDSIKNEANTKRQTQSEMQFLFDQQQAEEKLQQEKQDLIDKQEKQKQKYILITLSFIILLILIFTWFLNKRRKIEKQQKQLIESQNELVIQKNREILDSITYAKRIQTAILPQDKLVKEYLTDSFILYKPKDIVAGDFYWIEPFEEEIIFAVADCTGHGVPGALVSVVCHNALNRSVREFKLKSPSDILNKTRELIISEFQKSDELVNDGMDISICKLNLTTHQLDWAGANSPLWISKPDQNELIELKPSKQPIGQFTSYLPFDTISIQLEKKDTIYLFSDGYADQFGGENGKKMKSKQMKELFISIKDQPMAQQRISIDDFFEKWKSNLEQLDDVCVIGIRI